MPQSETGQMAWVGISGENTTMEDMKHVRWPLFEACWHYSLNIVQTGYSAGIALRTANWLYHRKRGLLKPRQIFHRGRYLSRFPAFGSLLAAPLLSFLYVQHTRKTVEDLYETAYLYRYNKPALFRERSFVALGLIGTWYMGLQSGIAWAVFGMAGAELYTHLFLPFTPAYSADFRSRDREIRDFQFDPLDWPRQVRESGDVWRYIRAPGSVTSATSVPKALPGATPRPQDLLRSE